MLGRLLFLALGAVILGGLLLSWLLCSGGGASKAATIRVEEGATLGRLCPGLERKHLIPGNCTTYRAAARLLGSRDPIQAGEVGGPAGTGGAALLDLLQHGRPVQRLITVTEGMPSIIVSEKLASNSYLSGPVPQIDEGSVLPNSYGYKRGEARAAIVRRMQSAMTKTLDGLWPKR